MRDDALPLFSQCAHDSMKDIVSVISVASETCTLSGKRRSTSMWAAFMLYNAMVVS